MAETYTYLVGGNYDASSGKNMWEVTDDGTTLSVTNSWLVAPSGTPNIRAIAKDLDGDYYVATSDDKVTKYVGSTMVIDTTWATSGVYTCLETIYAMTCGLGNELIVAVREYGIPDRSVIYINASGVMVWAKDHQSGATEFTAKVRLDSSGNPVGFGSRASTNPTFNKYLKADGSAVQHYWQAASAYASYGGWVFKNNEIVAMAHPSVGPFAISMRMVTSADAILWSQNLTGCTSTGNHLIVDEGENYIFITTTYNAGEDNIFRVNASDGLGHIGCDLGTTAGMNGMDVNKDGDIVVVTTAESTDEFGNTAVLRVLAPDFSTVRRSLGSASLPTGEAIVIRPSAQVAPQLVDMKTYSKVLCTVANNEFWYESTAGTMTELTAANGDIDTTQVFSMCEAYQKVHIANKAKLKVADFECVKINTADAGPTACVPSTILTGGTSGAKMIVKFCDAVTDDAEMNVYGYRTTAATFQAEAVEGDGGQSFTTSGVEVAGPHWYDWTPFGNDMTTYGTMPSQAYISCRYRGRLVLAGHNHYPHMWWMSRIGNPFDWLFDEGDARSAIRGSNVTDAGVVGDIIRAMIANGDDFLLFGCASSFYILRGDPHEGGSIDKLDENIGIFSPWSWCQDSKKNTYFFGTGGFYKIDSEGNQLENLSFNKMPDLIDRWAPDPSLHRITVGYDAQRHGIIISKISIADGTNDGYFYSLITEGFYPESYPKEAAPYSVFYYDSGDPAYNHLVLGCCDARLRYFKDTQKNDSDSTYGDNSTLINSYFTLAPQKLVEEDVQEGIAHNFCFTVGGGASGTTYKNSDGFSYAMHVADDAETLGENVLDAATARESGSFSTTGRQNRIRKRVRGLYFTVKCSNANLNETWTMNKLTFDIKPVGKK